MTSILIATAIAAGICSGPQECRPERYGIENGARLYVGVFVTGNGLGATVERVGKGVEQTLFTCDADPEDWNCDF